MSKQKLTDDVLAVVDRYIDLDPLSRANLAADIWKALPDMPSIDLKEDNDIARLISEKRELEALVCDLEEELERHEEKANGLRDELQKLARRV